MNKKVLDFIRALDAKTRREIGVLFMLLQMGKKLGEPQSKPMVMIHPTAYDLRIKDAKNTTKRNRSIN
ncbi:MAG: hypothetical protein H7235_02390 [Bdellovibrionaceae bacterium]|nr:hypothetical protein [Pseudobdellovibrionaceae bacterium]